MWIGSNKKCKRKPVDLRWKLSPCNNVKALGVNFSSTIPLNKVHQNWDMKVNKINNIIKVWKMRNLTIFWKTSDNKEFIIITIDLYIKCINSARACDKRH